MNKNINKETPYFMFKPEVLGKNYLEFERLCERYLGNYVIAYSIKTNSFGGVINKLDEMGSNFEVASLHEIIRTPEKAKVFNGNCKSEEELRIAIDRKFLINVDSKGEVDLISKILQGKELNIGLRVSLNESKFGFEDDKLEGVIDYCKGKGLKVICLHFHVGTQKNLRNFQDNLRGAERIVRRILEKVQLKYVDLGGGFPDKTQLKNLNVSLEDYFKLMVGFRKFGLKIILEPGRCLVADAFELITKVCYLKENFGKNYAVLDAGINLLGKVTLARYEFSKMNSDGEGRVNDGKGRVNHGKEEVKKEYILAGPLLFSNDTLGKYNGKLKEGDLLKVENVGAYCYNLAWEISYMKPKVFIETLK